MVKKRQPKTGAAGRSIGQQVLRRLANMKQDVLVDLDGVREGKRRSAELAEMAKEAADEVAGVSSLYAYYLQTHIGLSGVMQSVGTTPEMKAWRQRAIELEEEYMPGGPPMSPITDSYWESWLHYD
ncbi:MAG: hypothetical protein K8H88_11665, partial [Sandaracinaceae bacterium]|nr:hypothetical protein [Sandaracinaceae bacterium]